VHPESLVDDGIEVGKILNNLEGRRYIILILQRLIQFLL
jgi:hypothetical protein